MLFQKIFRPRVGDRQKRFMAFRLNTAGQNVYRGDVVILDTTTPTSQTADGVLDGRTIGANDFLWVTVTNSALASVTKGKVVGVIEGTHIGDRDTTTALADNSVVIVQIHGVFEDHLNMGSGDPNVTVGDILLANGGAYGVAKQDFTAINLEGTGTTTVPTDEAASVLGVVLKVEATYTRGASTFYGVTGYIRCGQ